MGNQKNQQVKKYFDKVSETYRDRFSNKKSFHQYFFYQRLELATESIDLTGKNVLDIGAGTGSLFDYLQDERVNCNYFATDISAKMLQQSRIPKDRQFVGNHGAIKFPIAKFDMIFLLGVVSYFDETELENTIEWAANHLSSKGQLIVSFSNKQSLDFRIRTWLHPILKLTGKGLIGQQFMTTGHTEVQIKNLLKPVFSIPKITYFNFTTTPINQIFPNISVRFAKWVNQKKFTTKTQRKLGADFIVIASKK